MTAASPSRRERRKAQTRGALLAAAQELLAAGRAEVSIKEITERADVGFGSFYNHFASKEELFEAAVLQAFDAHGTWLEEMLAAEDDPAAVFAASVRLTGRLVRTAPTLAQVLMTATGSLLVADRGLAPRARRDLVRAAEAGRFAIEEPDVALACASGALIGVMHLLVAQPSADVDATVDAMVGLVLRMLGMPADEAKALATRPLPTGDAP